jgi:hypothetical protein
VFRAELLGSAEASWEELFVGYTALKAITFSSSIEMIMRMADRLADMEVVFGSESIRFCQVWRQRNEFSSLLTCSELRMSDCD